MRQRVRTLQTAWVAVLTLAASGCASLRPVHVVATVPTGCEPLGAASFTMCESAEDRSRLVAMMKVRARELGGNTLRCCTETPMEDLEDCRSHVELTGQA